MKTLTGSLLSAQRSASALPYIRARLADYDGYAPRLRFVQHYDGAEPAGYHAACIAPDGSLIRARQVDNGASLLVSRVASPAPGSTFSSWTQVETDVEDDAGIALCVAGSDVWLFYLDNDGITIRRRISADNGATWGSAATVLATGGVKTWIAAAAADGSGGSDGDILLVWNEVEVLYRSRYTGSWGARTAATPTFAGVTGLAVAYLLDWQVVVCGFPPASGMAMNVWAVRYGDGVNQASNTWGSLKEVTGAGDGSDVQLSAPSLDYESGAWRLFFVESYIGDVAYDRLQWTTMGLAHDFNEEQWREPVAFDYADPKGVSIAVAAARVWLCSAEGVWSSALPANAELDASASVLEAKVAVDERRSLVELELDVILWGDELLQRGTRLELTPGYRTSSDEVALPYGYWVESVELVTGDEPRVVVKARDGWWLLERWRARRQLVWAAGDKTVDQLLLFLVARAGVEFTTEAASDALSSLLPAFTVHAGESGLTAVRRLLALVEDVPRWDGSQLVTNLTADDDASTYEFGITHAVLEATHRDLEPEINRVRVVGLGVLGEAFDYADAEASGERIATVIDARLTSGADAAERAAAVLRKSRLAAELAELRLFGVHCGVELWDVVELTDVQAGLEAAPRRVLGYGWSFRRGRRARYDMTVELGAV